MAILDTIALLTNKRRTSIASIVLDASVQETHTTSATVTSHPVESGADLTDHVHKEPDTIQITGIISNTSTVFPQALPGVALAGSIANLFSGSSNDLAQKAYQDLKKLVDERTLVTVETTLRTYENMLLENLTVTRDMNYGDALYFTCTARELRIVNVGNIKVESPVDRTLQAKKSVGKKTLQPLESKTQDSVTTKVERQTTLLGHIYNSIGR